MRIYILIFSCLPFLACKNEVAEEARQLPFYTSADFTPQWFTAGAKEFDTLHRIPDFSFTNQFGHEVSEQTVSGKIYVADFFFTSCPGICKKLTQNMLLVQQAFPKDTTLVLLSHSVTPETDSVSRLLNYANKYGIDHSNWHLLTGGRKELYSIARGSYFADEDMGVVQDAEDFLHTENILLVDRKRRIRGVYKGTSENAMKDLIADIQLLKKEL